jgi:ATP-dependent DNA helicase RecQ
MTRAKMNLYLHCNTDIFDKNTSGLDDFIIDKENYPVPEEITLQLTHKDVWLDFFKDKKKTILQQRAGQSLTYKNGYLRTSSGEDVAYISKLKRAELKDWEEKGYQVQSAKVNYILAWKGKDDEEESAVLLPELILKKSRDI